jgi:hypothetical protein
MPRGRKGEKRPANMIGNAVHVMRIARGGDWERSCEGPAGVGNRTMQETAKHFHDYAIQSVIEFRAARLSGKRP